MNRKGWACIFSVMLIVLLGFSSCNKGEKNGSTGKPMKNSAFRAELRIKQIPSEVKAGQKVNAIVTVKNISDQTWPSKGDSKSYYQVDLSYRLFDEADKALLIEGERTFLPNDLKPGESIELPAVLKAPDNPGKYTIRFDMVQEAVAWFGHKNKDNYSKPFTISVVP